MKEDSTRQEIEREEEIIEVIGEQSSEESFEYFIDIQKEQFATSMQMMAQNIKKLLEANMRQAHIIDRIDNRLSKLEKNIDPKKEQL